MDEESVTTVFSGVEVFRGLSEARLRTLAAEFDSRSFREGEVLLEEGESCQYLFLILEGEVEVFLPRDGEATNRFSDLRLATLGRGEIFGEYSFVDLRPASASIRAASDGKLTRIEHRALRRILDADCETARRVFENLLLIMIDRLRKDDRELNLVVGDWS